MRGIQGFLFQIFVEGCMLTWCFLCGFLSRFLLRQENKTQYKKELQKEKRKVLIWLMEINGGKSGMEIA